MGKRRVSDAQVATFVSRRRAGHSYRSIAKEYGIDARTVQAWVTRATESEGRDHWEAVSRQVDARYLEEHYRLLVHVGAGLLDLAHTEPCDRGPDTEAQALLDSAIRSAVQRAAHLLQERGVQVEPTRTTITVGLPTTEAPGLDWAEHLGSDLLKALTEHEPQVGKALAGWQSSWSDFAQARRTLAEEARNLLKHHRVADEMAAALAPEAVDEVLQTKLLGKEPRASQVVSKGGGLAALERHSQQGRREVYLGPQVGVGGAQASYESVLPQVSHEARLEPVAAAYRDLVDCAQLLLRLTSRLVLAGRPQGRCSLCPGFAVQAQGAARAKRSRARVRP